MNMVRPLLLLALILGLLGSLLFFAECAIIGRAAFTQALPIALLATVYFTYAMGAMAFLRRVARQEGKAATGFLLLNNVVRFLLTIIVLTIYGLVVREQFLVFTVNLFVFYVVASVFTGIYSVRLGHKPSNNKK